MIDPIKNDISKKRIKIHRLESFFFLINSSLEQFISHTLIKVHKRSENIEINFDQ